MPAQDCGRCDEAVREHVAGEVSADLNTAASWRRTSSSASVDADDRANKASQPQSRTKTR